MDTVLITGANRGIGLAFARQYAADGWRVIATCRQPEAAADLAAIAGQVEVHPLDVTDEEQIAALAAGLVGTGLDILVNNAGINLPDRAMDGPTMADWNRLLAVNITAPMLVTRALLPNLLAGRQKKAVFVSSRMGSIGANTSSPELASTKAVDRKAKLGPMSGSPNTTTPLGVS